MDLGVWGENADRLVPRGEITWTDSANHGSAGQIAGKVVTTITRRPGGYFLRIPGWQWHVTPEMGVYRVTNSMPGDKITRTPVKLFKTRAQAKREASAILAA